MTTKNELKPPYRIAYLSGGIKVVFGSNNTAVLSPSMNSENGVLLPTAKPSNVHQIVNEIGVNFLGFGNAIDEDELAQSHNYNFSVWPMGTPNTSPIRHAAPFWKAVSKNMLDTDQRVMTYRVGSQISVIDIRILNTLNAYNVAGFETAARPSNLNRITGDIHTNRFAAETQGLLNDLYSLRDFILQLYSSLRFSTIPKIDKLKKRIEQESNPTDLDQTILKSISPEGEIYKLSSYRDLVAHVLPIFSAQSSFHIVQGAFLRGYTFPRVVFPLFEELLEAKKESRGEKRLKEYNLSRKYVEQVLSNPNLTDALDFCCAAYVHLLSIGQHVAQQFELEPYLFTITDDDIKEVSDFRVVNGRIKASVVIKNPNSE
jgi:hypothetical protein